MTYKLGTHCSPSFCRKVYFIRNITMIFYDGSKIQCWGFHQGVPFFQDMLNLTFWKCFSSYKTPFQPFFQGILVLQVIWKYILEKSKNKFQVKTNHSSQCEYPSSGNSNLTSHFKIHSEDKPNQWNVTWVSQREVV